MTVPVYFSVGSLKNPETDWAERFSLVAAFQISLDFCLTFQKGVKSFNSTEFLASHSFRQSASDPSRSVEFRSH